MKKVFFTGHRNVRSSNILIANLNRTLMELVNTGITDFYAGGALGWDTMCEDAVLIMRDKFPQIKLHLILPCPPEEQTIKWLDTQKQEYYRILNAADSVQIVSEYYHKDCMKERNARLVESGDICVCYFNEKCMRSGTAQTVRMAEKSGAVIFNLFE